MTKDTTMIRVSSDLRDALKDYAQTEGRTLEWCANTAVEQFIMGNGIEKDRQEKRMVRAHVVKEGRELGILESSSAVEHPTVKAKVASSSLTSPVILDTRGKQYSKNIVENSDGTISPAVPGPLNKETKDYSLCKHGAIKGFCKQGCK